MHHQPMSQHTVYKCDHCKKEIGAKPHISLMVSLGAGSGIAVPPGDSHSLWHTERLHASFLHFHNGKCVGEFFDNLIKKVPVKK